MKSSTSNKNSNAHTKCIHQHTLTHKKKRSPSSDPITNIWSPIKMSWHFSQHSRERSKWKIPFTCGFRNHSESILFEEHIGPYSFFHGSGSQQVSMPSRHFVSIMSHWTMQKHCLLIRRLSRRVYLILWHNSSTWLSLINKYLVIRRIMIGNATFNRAGFISKKNQ